MSWISVKDELPNDKTWVLISSSNIVTMAFFEGDDSENYWLCHNDAKDKTEWDCVTHWQPLPQPPREK